MKRLTLIGPVYPYRGGIAHYNSMLEKSLHDNGVTTQVISYRRQYPAWLYPGKSDKDPSQQVLKTSAEFVLDPMYPWTWHDTVKEISDFNPEMVVIHWWTTFWALQYAYISRLLSRKGFRVVYIIHNVLPHERRAWDKRLAKIAFSLVNDYLTHTEREKHSLQEITETDVVKVCPHPVYPMFSDEIYTKTESREKLNIPVDKSVLLFFGIVRPYKGLKISISALVRLKDWGREPVLLIAGEFWEDKSEYEQQIQQLGLNSQVITVDRYLPNEEVGLYFSAADVMIAPYTAGTQSGVAKLALGYGLPLIVSDIVADGIATQDQDTVLVVPHGDPEALAVAIDQFLVSQSHSEIKHTPTGDDWWRIVNALEEFIE